MSTTTYCLIALLLSGLLLWQLVSGVALGGWWHRQILREDSPKTYWFVLAIQCAILIAFLVTGKSWHIR